MCAFNICLTTQFDLTEGTATPQPELESSHSRALVGEQIHMRCVVRVKKGVNVHYSWTYSSGEVGGGGGAQNPGNTKLNSFFK